MSKDDIKQAVYKAIQTMPQGKAIQRVRLFGSHLHGDFTDTSDVDLLIDIDKDISISFFAFYDIMESFSRALDKKVDVVTPEGLSRFIRDKVLNEAETVYER